MTPTARDTVLQKGWSMARVRQFPRWTIILVGLGLAGLAIILGLFLEPAASALSPTLVEPTPTLPAILYGHGRSDSCETCHFSIDALQASADDVDTAAHYAIDPSSVDTTHGRLGCIACHDGNGEAPDKAEAHEGMVPDMSVEDPMTCLICHKDLPDEIPNDMLETPHGTVVEHISTGAECDVHCSDCHGAVGHGFDPVSGEVICSMSTCVACHEERQLDVQVTDCDACHIGPHDVAASLTCDDCHESTTTWQEVSLGVHPVKLTGKHAEIGCFDCHDAPDFKGLNNVCADCHTAGHDDMGEDCTACHEPGGTWAPSAGAWEGHEEIWDQYKGAHVEATCEQCHGEPFEAVDPSCTTCHQAPVDHEGGRDTIDCTYCHQADRSWNE